MNLAKFPSLIHFKIWQNSACVQEYVPHTLNGIISVVWARTVPILCTHAHDKHHFNAALTPLWNGGATGFVVLTWKRDIIELV